MKQLCKKCRKNKRAQRGRQRWCLPCRNRWERKHRKPHRLLSREAKLRANCRAYANVYQRRGKLKKPSRCEGCRKRRKLEKHHDDYRKPLKIKWLCEECHDAITFKKQKAPR